MANSQRKSSKNTSNVERDSLGRKKSSGHTGPKTTAGKNRLRFNALKHARHAKTKILPFEDEHEYQDLAEQIYEDLKPDGAVEAGLVDQYIDARWRSRRMEGRIWAEQESIFANVNKSKIAIMLEIPEMFHDHIPDYFLNSSKRFGPKQTEVADICWRQYARLVKEFAAEELTDLEEIRIHYDVLFGELEQWARNQKTLPPLLTPQREQLNAPWIEEDAQLLFEVLRDFAFEMYFQANFMVWKPQIQNWLQIWYFMQKRELREIDQYDLVLIKELHLQHTILERLAKIQKLKRENVADLQMHFAKPDPEERKGPK